MPLSVKDVSEMQKYINGVMERSNHHAGNVNEVVLAMAGAIVWKKDTDKPIQVMIHEGETKNVLWIYINRTRYAFSYNHKSGQIELRKGSTQGKVLYSFDNASTVSQIKQIFETL